MASLAGEMAGSGKTAKPPISTHPAFPFIVALWFAALLGIGSLVVPVPVIEKLVTVTGISSLVPQTAPPLGFTARALIALVGTVGGGLIGLLIARKVAKAHRPEAPSRFSRTLADSGVTARKPISAREELGEIGLDGNAPRGRRALAIEEESGPSEVFELAPLPGGPAHPPHIGLDALDPNALDPNALDLAEDEALDLDDFAVETMAEPAQPGFQLLHGLQEAGAPRDPLTFGRSRQEFHADDLADLTDQHDSFADSSTEAANDDLASADQETAADLHFSPPSLTRSAVAEPDVAEQVDDMPEDLPLADLVWSAPTGETRQTFVAPGEEPAIFMPQETQPMQDTAMSARRHEGEPGQHPQWQESTLDDLGLVQLAQRLGSSIEKRRATRAALAAAAAHAPLGTALSTAIPTTPLADEFDMAEAEEAALAMAAYFNAPHSAVPFAPQAEPTAAEPAFEAPAAEEPQTEELAEELAGAPRMAPMGERQMFQPVVEEAAPLAEDYFPGLARIDIGEEDDDADDDDLGRLAASFSLPLGPLAAPAPVAAPSMAPAIPSAPQVAARVSFAATPADPVPAFAESSDVEVDDGEDTAETDFGSLLALNNPFQQRGQAFVRIENEPQPEEDAIEPAVVFPGQGTAGSMNRPFAHPAFTQPAAVPQAPGQHGDAEENARALREALLNLQRMSGAA